MNHWAQNCFRTIGSTVWCGVTLGFGLVLGYSLIFLVYAIVRSSLAIEASLAPSEGLVGTLVANALALVMAVLGFALLFGVIGALGEGLILLIVYGLSTLLNPQHLRRRAAWIGLAAAGIPAIALIIFIEQALGLYFAALWPFGFLFWLGLPCLIFIGATTWLSWQSTPQQAA